MRKQKQNKHEISKKNMTAAQILVSNQFAKMVLHIHLVSN
jgi:hypothetical protein